jgi:hypothetical protein
MSGNYPALTETQLPRLIQSIRDLFAGRTNAVGQFTLAVSPATSTTVKALNCGPKVQPYLTPRSASAAVELAAGTLWVSSVGNGSFTVQHSSSAATDRVFGYGAFG